jgi:hypothetical protein
MGWIASRLRRRGSPAPANGPNDERDPEPAPAPPPGQAARADPEPHEPPEPAPPIPRIEAAPREWNLWELERIARQRADEDAVRSEERSYLLIYLREFASADGVLPADFDALVRESFGDALDPAYS